MTEIWDILRLLVTVASFIFGIYQGTKSHQLKKIIHSQTWDLHTRANNATGAMQKAFTVYKEKYSDNLDPELIEIFSKSSAFNQDLFLDTIRHIYLSEPFDLQTVQKWIDSGKLDKDYKQFFINIANIESIEDEKNNSFLKRIKKKIF